MLTENLNEVQQKAVHHETGPLIIFAGAGSGKTRVITNRIEQIIRKNLASPWEICAVTFTNKAAGEMSERIVNLVGSGDVMVKTFHSLCLYILLRESSYLEYKSGFTIYDTDLQLSLVREVIKGKNLEKGQVKAGQLASEFNLIKDLMTTPEEYYNQDDDDDRLKTELFIAYENAKKERGGLDFGDLISKTVLLLKNNPDLKKKYSSKWKYLLVDEFQDTNTAQYELVLQLGQGHGNVCVVGDDDQLIYSWRGARIENIMNFETDFPGTTVVKLEENYRSTRNIISPGSRMIRFNSRRKEKKLFTSNEEGDPVVSIPTYDERDEAQKVVREIGRLTSEDINNRQIVILYRTNQQARYFEEQLRNFRFPYKVFGGMRFYDRAEIRDIMAYLNVIINPQDDTSLRRIINVPARGVGDKSVEKLASHAVAQNSTLLQVLPFAAGLKIRKQSASSLAELYSVLDDLRQDYLNGILPSAIIQSLVERTGIVSHYEKEEDYDARVENLEEFAVSVAEYEKNTQQPDLAEFLLGIALLNSGDEKKEMSNFVSLMTVHNAKGLEYDYVFLTGMEEGVFPHTRFDDDFISDDKVEEERRLCYVAVTRARKKLYVSYRSFSSRMNREALPSRFLDEMGIFHEPVHSPVYRKPAATDYKKGPDYNKKSSDSKYRPGMTVRHNAYGTGKIIEISGAGNNIKAKIKFGNIEKKFFLSYTRLDIVDIE